MNDRLQPTNYALSCCKVSLHVLKGRNEQLTVSRFFRRQAPPQAPVSLSHRAHVPFVLKRSNNLHIHITLPLKILPFLPPTPYPLPSLPRLDASTAQSPHFSKSNSNRLESTSFAPRVELGCNAFSSGSGTHTTAREAKGKGCSARVFLSSPLFFLSSLRTLLHTSYTPQTAQRKDRE